MEKKSDITKEILHEFGKNGTIAEKKPKRNFPTEITSEIGQQFLNLSQQFKK